MIRLIRKSRIVPGKQQEAIQWAKELIEYVDRSINFRAAGIYWRHGGINFLRSKYQINNRAP